MEFKGKAWYNLLRISHQENPSLLVEPWQVVEYRSLSEEELFFRLSIPKENFFLYAESCDTPEELVECLWVNEADVIGQEKTYLLIFELWRRLLPHKQSLSLFCDELDHLIARFDQGKELEDEFCDKIFRKLEDILDQNTSPTTDAKATFSLISEHMAHDLEGFLYDYILELIEKNNDTLATSLVEAFEDCVAEKKWFVLLRAYLFSSSNMEISNRLIHRLLEEENECPLFLKEILFFLQESKEEALTFACLDKLLPLVSSEEEEEILRCAGKPI